jgi:mycofactocin precursor
MRFPWAEKGRQARRREFPAGCVRLPQERDKEDPRVKEREETEFEYKNLEEADRQEPDILEEIEIEDFAVDGICGVY